jgi:hypothetical protein
MSKALGSILTIGAAVAVNVIPGAGQAISAFLLGTVGLGVGTAVAVSGAITSGLTLAGVSSGLSLAGSVLSGRPAARADTTESSRKSPIPPRTRAYGKLRLYGDWLLFSYKSDGTPVDVWAFHDGQANAISQVYINDDKVTIIGGVVQRLTDGRYRDDRVLAGYSLGLPTETAFSAVIAALPGIWTSNHRGDGVVTGYLIKQLTKSDKFLETYPNGDDMQMSLAGEWSLVFDFRDPAQDAYDPSTWVYSDNPVLAFLHFQLTQRGKDFNTHILPQLASWTAAANDCGGAVPLAAGGSEPRYRLALAYKATETPAAVESAILNTFDGWYCENELGELIVYSGRYTPPTVGLSESEIVSYTISYNVPAEDAINEVLVTYVSEASDFATVDAQSWRNQAAIDASGREPVSSSLEAQIPSPSQGRRLAKRKMLRANAPARGTVVTTYAGRALLGRRYINLRIEEAGAVFYDGPVEITSSPERDLQTGGLRFDWSAIDPDIDAWNPATEEGYVPPTGDNPDIAELAPPTIVSASPTFDDGASTAQIYMIIDGPNRADLTWYAQWRVAGTSSWNAQSYVDTDPGDSVEIVTNVVPVSSLIEVQAYYATGDGRSSPPSNIVTVDTDAE